MSHETVAEKVSSLPMSQGKARCRLSQLAHRAAHWTTYGGPAQAGDTFALETRMGDRETWRVVEAGKDPLLEREEP